MYVDVCICELGVHFVKPTLGFLGKKDGDVLHDVFV